MPRPDRTEPTFRMLHFLPQFLSVPGLMIQLRFLSVPAFQSSRFNSAPFPAFLISTFHLLPRDHPHGSSCALATSRESLL